MRKLSLAALVVALGTAGCGGGGTSPVEAGPMASRNETSRRPADFTSWRDDFRRQALARGISPAVFDAAFADGPRFLIDGANPGDDVVSGGLAFNIQATERTAVEMGYSGLYKDEYRDNRIYGRFSVKF